MYICVHPGKTTSTTPASFPLPVLSFLSLLKMRLFDAVKNTARRGRIPFFHAIVYNFL
jgi:hypothetical protein